MPDGRELLQEQGRPAGGPALADGRSYENDQPRGLARALGWCPAVLAQAQPSRAVALRPRALQAAQRGRAALLPTQALLPRIAPATTSSTLSPSSTSPSSLTLAPKREQALDRILVLITPK